MDRLTSYASDPQKSWSEQAAQFALRAGGSYRVLNGKVIFTPLGQKSYALSESDQDFRPEGLSLVAGDGLINDVTVVGSIEPQAHVKDYFVGDGYTLKFYLSQVPFMSSNRTLLDEEYASLDPTRWKLNDPSGVITASRGELVVVGGTGAADGTQLTFAEKVELGGTLVLQHGDVAFEGASNGILRGTVHECDFSEFLFRGVRCYSRRRAVAHPGTGEWKSCWPGHHDQRCASLCADDPVVQFGGIPATAAVPFRGARSGRRVGRSGSDCRRASHRGGA